MTTEQRAELRKAAEEPVYQLCKADSISLSSAWIDVDAQAYEDSALYAEYGRRISVSANPATILQLLDYVESLERDAARYRWLRERMTGVDFDWCELGITALVFEMPDGCAFDANCDKNIDAAMGESK